MSDTPTSQQPSSPPTQNVEAEHVNIELQDEDLNAVLEIANERKQSGNDAFRSGKWEEALALYEAALNALPRRRGDESNNVNHDVEDDDEDSLDPPTASPPKGKGKGKEEDQDEHGEVVSPEVKALKEKCAQLRSVLNANIGACYVKMGDHKKAVEACTEALKDDPSYIKALERRASSNDILDTWSSLTAAQEDYQKLLSLSTLPASQRPIIARKLQNVKPRVEAAQKRETAEMMDKLKGLGNNILGKFGLSTDNFKFEPNGQGGYSMNFVR
ncbi:hypothetical protein CVT24_005760 [Panaeolus cyanescens]|uniref:Tetratricopeptide repeat protein 1 n=1 Tax=Panaeolus cyanescens TaxID=181874 RepID=A0A409YF08_9AGAR|nr:hypothetical protein CVT24_005760 [Panaeolus cyanescens]